MEIPKTKVEPVDKEIKKEEVKSPIVTAELPELRGDLEEFKWTLEDELNPLLLGC